MAIPTSSSAAARASCPKSAFTKAKTSTEGERHFGTDRRAYVYADWRFVRVWCPRCGRRSERRRQSRSHYGSKNSVYANKLSHVHENVTHFAVGTGPRTAVSSSLIQFSPASDTAGVFVAVGDYSGTGRNDIALAIPQTKWPASVSSTAWIRRARVMDAFSFVAGPDGGVAVAMKDVSNDGKADVIAAGAYGTSIVRILGGGTGGLMASFTAFGSSYQGGVFVG